MRGAVQRQWGWMRGGLPPPGQGHGDERCPGGCSGTAGVQGGRRKPSGGSVPTHSPAVAPGAQRPAQRGADGDHQLTNYGQGHLKTWPLQHRGCKGKRRQVVGHRHAPRRLDGNKGWWLMRGTGRTPAAPHASPRGERRKKIKEEKAGFKSGRKSGIYGELRVPAARRAWPLGTVRPARTGRKRTATAGANLRRGAGGTAAEEGRKGGGCFLPAAPPGAPLEQEAGGGQPRSHAARRSQRGSRGTAKTQHRGESRERAAKQLERLNSAKLFKQKPGRLAK